MTRTSIIRTLALLFFATALIPPAAADINCDRQIYQALNVQDELWTIPLDDTGFAS